MCKEIDVYEVDSGKILKKVIKSGDGEIIANTSSVKIHYSGSLLNGIIFDSSKDRCGAFEFNLGEGTVIPGLDIGIRSMSRGEQAILTIAPEYAFRSEGNPPIIPPDTVLKFDVEVLHWKPDDLSPKRDGSIIRRHRIKEGLGYTYPQSGSLVEVHIEGGVNEYFEERNVIFKLGEGENEKIVKGIELALQKFKRGERSKVIIQSKYAFDHPAFKDCGVPPGQTVEYTIELKRFERSKETWSMDDEEKIRIAQMFKEKGNQLFKMKKYIPSINMYRSILEYLVDKDGEQIMEGDGECGQLVLSAHLNLSLSCLRIEDYEMAQKMADKAINIDPENDKAHYRCGQALLGLSNEDKALHHFTKCLKINPNNSEARALYSHCMTVVRKRSENEKKLYMNMFDKFSEVDIKVVTVSK